jgi:hypothetical protein
MARRWGWIGLVGSFVLWTTTLDRAALLNKTSPDTIDVILCAAWIGLAVWLTVHHRDVRATPNTTSSHSRTRDGTAP